MITAKTPEQLTRQREVWKRLSEEGFSLIRLLGKDPSKAEGKNWERFCIERRDPDKVRFRTGENAGIPCGPANKILVLDKDDPEKFNAFLAEHGYVVPKTRRHGTGAEGKEHCFFLYPNDGEEYRNRSRQKWGFDVRGIGGQVVAPGSIHPDTGREYGIIDDSPIAPAPKWLLDISREPKRQQDQRPHPPSAVEDDDLFTWEDGRIESLPIKRVTRDLILNDPGKGNRSEPIMKVCNALVWSNLEDHQIFEIFEQYPIGEKWRTEHNSNESWLQQHIDKARAKIIDRAKKPSRKQGRSDFTSSPEETFFGHNGKPLKHKKAAAVLLPRLEDLAYNPVVQKWLKYENGLWSCITDHEAAKIVDKLIDSIDPTFDYNRSYRDGILDQLSLHLCWDNDHQEPAGAIPFQNGVLFLEGMRFEPHQMENRFTWQLPFQYTPMATCEPVKAWLFDTVKDKMQVDLLRAYLNAILTGRSDLHRYLELIGPGGTGKSTFIRLAEAIVGKANVHVSELKHLENNRFETAKLYGKRLCCITDAEKYSGDVSILKAITGGDSIRFEEKHKQNGQPFRFQGMVLIAANQDVGSSDYTSGLQRRRITVRFENVVPPERRRDLDEEFRPHLSGVINWALAMPKERVNQLLRDTDRHVKTLAGSTMQTLINTNPIAAWVNDCLVYNSLYETGVGTKKENVVGQIENASELLYPSYCQWCKETNYKAVAQNRFVMLLKDLLMNQMKLPGIKHLAKRDGKVFTCIAIRGQSSGVFEGLSPVQAYFGVTDCDAPVTDDVTDQTRMVTNVTDFPPNYSEFYECVKKPPGTTCVDVVDEAVDLEKSQKPPKSVTSVTEPIQSVTGPSQSVTVRNQPPPSPSQERRVKCSKCLRLSGATCTKTRRQIDGISLLRDCPHYQGVLDFNRQEVRCGA